MRRRLRDLGYAVGRLPTGLMGGLVDVPGVLIGHATVEGDSLRTGVTAVLPHEGNPYTEKVLCGCHVVNGYGKAAGLSSERQLRRLAARGGLGLGRAGSFASNASGEYVLAFSTAHRLAHRSASAHDELRLLRDDSSALRLLFEAAVEGTAEPVLGSLCRAESMEGRDGHRAEAIPHDLLVRAPVLRPIEAG